MMTIDEHASIQAEHVPHGGFLVESRRWTYLRNGAKVLIARLPREIRGMICRSSWDLRWTDHPEFPDADAWWHDAPYTYAQEAWISGWRDRKAGRPRPEPEASAAGYDAAGAAISDGITIL